MNRLQRILMWIGAITVLAIIFLAGRCFAPEVHLGPHTNNRHPQPQVQRLGAPPSSPLPPGPPAPPQGQRVPVTAADDRRPTDIPPDSTQIEREEEFRQDDAEAEELFVESLRRQQQ